jgi:hypothetical protein
MNVRRGSLVAGIIGLTLIASGFSAATARGDGGTLRAWKQHGDYEIAIFTEPSPVVASPVDISVLLIDRNTGEPDGKVRVTIEVSPEGKPDKVVRHLAVEQAATNKLFRAASFELRETGRCGVDVCIEGPVDRVKIHFDLIVEMPWSTPTGIWPWVLWPLPAIGLYGMHRRLVRRRTKSPRRPNSPARPAEPTRAGLGLH